MDGSVVSLWISTGRNQPMVSRDAVRAVPGKGIEGDHRFDETGTKSQKHPGREITFFEQEALEAVFRDYKLPLGANETRRNVLVRGVALNHLVGREFTVGGVRCRGIELCEPCVRLESLTAKGMREALIHRGGLRAQILTEGEIRTGDPVRGQS